VKILVDANLSPRLAKALEVVGHQTVHVGDVGLLTAADDEIFEFAQQNDHVILSADSDFGTLLARHNTAHPSFVLLRHTNELTPDEQIALLVANLPAVAEDLDDGAVVTITPDRMRIRKLPMFP
jgi:predicted nuclease of predicted toxin-antitoxin system